MKLPLNISAAAAIVVLAVGLAKVWRLSADSDLALALLALPAAIALSLGPYLLHLRERVTTLEKNARNHE